MWPKPGHLPGAGREDVDSGAWVLVLTAGSKQGLNQKMEIVWQHGQPSGGHTMGFRNTGHWQGCAALSREAE